MAEYLSTDPNAGAPAPKYLSTDPNAGATGPANQDPEFMAQRTAKLKGAEGGDSTAGFVGGNINLGLANVAGLPVDIARNMANLGIAGFGRAKGAMGGKNLPDLIPESSPGGSQWMQEQIKKVPGMVPPSATPQSKGGEYAARAIQTGASAAVPMSRAQSLGQVARQIPAGMESGLGAQAATDVGGPEWAGVGAMAPGLKGIMKPPTVSQEAAAGRKAERFGKAKEMGIPVPPREMKVDQRQLAQQDAVNKEMRQPLGTEISPKTLAAYRSAHEDDYTSVINAPQLKNGVIPSVKFQQEIKAIGDEISRPGKDLPETFKGMNSVIKLLGDYGYGKTTAQAPQFSAAVIERNPQLKPPPPAGGKPIPPDIAMRAIKQLRSDATTNFTSDSPKNVALARVQRRIANSLEDLIEENLKNAPELMQKFRAARTAIAKSFDIESSLDPTTREFSAQRLSRLMTEGRPLTGNLEKLAEVGGEFPGATKTPVEGDLFSKRMSPFGVTHPGAIAAHGMTRMLDPITMSKPYQSLFVDPANRPTPEQLRMLRYFLGAQAANQGQIPQPPQ